jgi:hypothetical protein
MLEPELLQAFAFALGSSPLGSPTGSRPFIHISRASAGVEGTKYAEPKGSYRHIVSPKGVFAMIGRDWTDGLMVCLLEVWRSQG